MIGNISKKPYFRPKAKHVLKMSARKHKVIGSLVGQVLKQQKGHDPVLIQLMINQELGL